MKVTVALGTRRASAAVRGFRHFRAACMFSIWIAGAAPVAAAGGAESFRVLSGGNAVPFSLPGLTVRHHDLSMFRGRGLLLHFFATWCAPCRPELQILRTFREQWDGEPLEILAISTGEPKSRVARFFQDFPVNFPVALDEDKRVTKAWQVVSLPTTYLLDRELRPRLIVETDVDWTDPAVAALLNAILNEDERPMKPQEMRAD